MACGKQHCAEQYPQGKRGVSQDSGLMAPKIGGLLEI